VLGNFSDAQVGIKENDIEIYAHSESMDSLAGVEPEAGIGVEMADPQQSAAARGAIGRGTDLRSNDAILSEIFQDVGEF
jgi:hypothetical protein